MPTFKNETAKYIDCNIGTYRVFFSPGETRELPFWVPYKRLGLTLTDANYPTVPETVLASGTFSFTSGMERRFDLEFCEKYDLTVSVSAGAVKLYCGNAKTPITLDASSENRYQAQHDWELAPYIRIAASTAATVTLHCEQSRGGCE